MSLRRTLAAIAVGTTVTASALVAGAPPAAADQTWVQSFERPSAQAPCTAPVDETPWQAGWVGSPEWTPTWEQWPNGGTGGWTCSRSITWAFDAAAYPSAGCVTYNGSNYLQFAGGWAISPGSDVYSDSSCTTFLGPLGTSVVYAPAGFDALSLCREAFGPVGAVAALDNSVFRCEVG